MLQKLYIQCNINDSKLHIQIRINPLLHVLQIDGIQNMLQMEFVHFMKLDPYRFMFTFILALVTLRKFLFYSVRTEPCMLSGLAVMFCAPDKH